MSASRGGTPRRTEGSGYSLADSGVREWGLTYDTNDVIRLTAEIINELHDPRDITDVIISKVSALVVDTATGLGKKLVE